MPSRLPSSSPRRGRPPQVEVAAEDAVKLQNLYMRSNRTRKDGSRILAARLAAQTCDIAGDLADAILKPRKGCALPKCIKDAMHVAPAVIARQRNQRDADLSGIYIPGCLRMGTDIDGALRRLNPGERQSWDDATINFGVVIPWPWGGDKCSDRYGVRVGRFQLLTCVDDATDFCPGFDYVIRMNQSYRSEDVVAAQFRMWRNSYMPERVMLEGGCWQANRAQRFHASAGVVVDDATGRPHSKLVECFFNRLWSPLSLMPGHVGRWRGEQKAESDIYCACRDGRADPRESFPELNQALEDLATAIHYINSKPVTSPKYGEWIPAQRHAEWIADHPRPQASADLWFHAAPIVEQRTVRRGMVQVRCRSPYDEQFTYHFAEENLWNFDGCPVLVYFDPWGELKATIVLEKPFRGVAAGTVICEAVCIEDAPQVCRSGRDYHVELATHGHETAMAMRLAQRGAIRREHRTINEDGHVTAFASEQRIDDRAALVESIPQESAADKAIAAAIPSARREDWRNNLDERVAEAERYEAEARRRGELLPA
jgi:hypothetical protein